MKVFPSYKDKEDHTVKYLQPNNKGPYLYIPKEAGKQLSQEADEQFSNLADKQGSQEANELNSLTASLASSASLLVVEGEKKALKGCQEGFLAIGVEGCWNFLRDGQPIEDLDLIQWSWQASLYCL